MTTFSPDDLRTIATALRARAAEHMRAARDIRRDWHGYVPIPSHHRIEIAEREHGAMVCAELAERVQDAHDRLDGEL